MPCARYNCGLFKIQNTESRCFSHILFTSISRSFTYCYCTSRANCSIETVKQWQALTHTTDTAQPKLRASGYSSFHSCVAAEGRSIGTRQDGRTTSTGHRHCGRLGQARRWRARRTRGRSLARRDCEPALLSKLEKLSPS